MTDLIVIIGKWLYSMYLKRKKFNQSVKKCYHCKKRIYWWQPMKRLTYNFTPIHSKCYKKAKKEGSLPPPPTIGIIYPPSRKSIYV